MYCMTCVCACAHAHAHTCMVAFEFGAVTAVGLRAAWSRLGGKVCACALLGGRWKNKVAFQKINSAVERVFSTCISAARAIITTSAVKRLQLIFSLNELLCAKIS